MPKPKTNSLVNSLEEMRRMYTSGVGRKLTGDEHIRIEREYNRATTLFRESRLADFLLSHAMNVRSNNKKDAVVVFIGRASRGMYYAARKVFTGSGYPDIKLLDVSRGLLPHDFSDTIMQGCRQEDIGRNAEKPVDVKANIPDILRKIDKSVVHYFEQHYNKSNLPKEVSILYDLLLSSGILDHKEIIFVDTGIIGKIPMFLRELVKLKSGGEKEARAEIFYHFWANPENASKSAGIIEYFEGQWQPVLRVSKLRRMNDNVVPVYEKTTHEESYRRWGKLYLRIATQALVDELREHMAKTGR